MTKPCLRMLVESVISGFALLLLVVLLGASAGAKVRCGVAKVDVSPENLPVIQNGGFLEALITRNLDPLYARAMVFDDGNSKIAMVVVDSCMIPRGLCDQAKTLIHEQTGIPQDRVLIAATHTHSAPSVMDFCLGSRKDPAYAKFLPGKIAEAIVEANAALQPAKVGFGRANADEFTKNRRWIRRSDKLDVDPFGERTVQAMMHPGHQNSDFIGPSGPVDPWLSMISVRTLDDKPLGLMANFSMHYFSGHSGASADYYGKFARAMKQRLAPEDDQFVAMMSQGTSGDLWWGDYALPERQKWSIDEYTEKLAALVENGMQEVEHTESIKLAMKETRITLKRRLPDERRLAWADAKLEKMGDGRPRNRPEVYAEQARWIDANRSEELVLQVLRIGDIAITGMPNEVYAITGLKLKRQSPFPQTFNISLANGASGYIPPPEQHALGGYTTWPARTAGLEVDAEPKILQSLTKMLFEHRAEIDWNPKGEPFQRNWGEMLNSASDVRAYSGLESFELGPHTNDAIARAHGRVAFGVPGIPHRIRPFSYAFHFAGGRIESDDLMDVNGIAFSTEMWFWNGLPIDSRHVTGILHSHGNHVLGISGIAAEAPGRLFFCNELGRTETIPRAWNHVMLTHDKTGRVHVFLNGDPNPEISTVCSLDADDEDDPFTIGARSDGTSWLEGRIDEFTVFSRTFSPDEVAKRFKSFKIEPPTKPEWGSVREKNARENAQRKMENLPMSPHETVAATYVPDGFELELVAAEPQVVDPVAIDWDANGRMWVVEMADYPYGMDGNGKAGGRLRYLEDTDGDGYFERSKVVADKLSFPTSVMVGEGGRHLVTAAPDLLSVDEYGNTREMFTGFVQGNQQLRANSLRWGLDNWIYCASGGHHVGFGKDTVITDSKGKTG